MMETHCAISSNQRWNRAGFLTTGTGLSRSDRTGPAGLPVTTGLPATGRSEIQTGTGPGRPVTGTGSISASNKRSEYLLSDK
jgi:hypothetical protein